MLNATCGHSTSLSHVHRMLGRESLDTLKHYVRLDTCPPKRFAKAGSAISARRTRRPTRGNGMSSSVGSETGDEQGAVDGVVTMSAHTMETVRFGNSRQPLLSLTSLHMPCTLEK